MARVQRFMVVDNSNFSPTRLTATIDSSYACFSRSSPCSRFQAVRIVMASEVFVFLLVSFLVLSLALLWRLCWLPLEPSHSQAGKRRPPVHRLLKPRTPLDCPLCRLNSSAVRPASAPVRPWGEVKSRRGAPKRIPTEGFACPNQQCPYYGITDSPLHGAFWGWQAWSC
jgi:hypothetical protein